MNLSRKSLLAIILLGVFVAIGSFDKLPFERVDQSNTSPIEISESRRTHILYGDKTGGGHLFGTGKPCKSEFPKDWSGEDIIQTAQNIAANDNLNWKTQKNGYSVAETMIDGIRVRVVLDRKRNDVVTTYPVNVKRNPCPAANDNNPG